jgi:acyl-coenzyme A synthetase/AMP-(fatty) acid ligase
MHNMPLYDRIASLAAEDLARPAIVECDDTGTTVRTVTRGELLAFVDAARADALSEPLMMEGAPTADFLLRCWATWAAGRTVVPLDSKRDTDELRAYKMQAVAKAQGEALILFTSGTTARPKGARLALENLLVNAHDIGEWLHITDGDRFLVLLPLHHINSTTFCLATLVAGGCVVLAPRYSASNFWNLAARTGATLTSVVQPIIFDQLSRHTEYDRVKNNLRLTRIQIGSAPVVPASVREFKRRFGIPLYQGYGQTETALRVTGVPMDIPAGLYDRLVEENSIGTPMPWATLEIMDEMGSLLGEDTEGELIVKGAAVMRGYIGGEEAFKDGWFLTGDIGYYKTIEGRRYFYLKGRKKEIIIKGGVNISPVAVEEALLQLSPALGQVYVIGVPDDRYGEEVGAMAIWKDAIDKESAMRALKLTLLLGTPQLREYEAPKYLGSIAAEALPTTSTGKVQRAKLKEIAPLKSIYSLSSSADYRFEVIHAQSPHAQASNKLYNHCWQPLTMHAEEYRQFLRDTVTLGAFDTEGALHGQVAFKKAEDALVCVSICSAQYQPKEIPTVDTVPTREFVEQYVRTGNDPVINFHTRMGAEITEVIPQGRPADKSACGYTVLVSYPEFAGTKVEDGAPVSIQLIQATRLLAKDIACKVHALTRPGGLAAFLSGSML